MEYDYIVVGAGSAGCVVANRLVAEHGAKVLMLEAGNEDDSSLIRMPAGTFKMLFKGSPLLKRYESEPQPSLGGRTVSVPQGNVVGGGSSVNAMAYVRGSRYDYDRWDEATGGAGWKWDDLLPYFRRQEGNQRFDNASHGGDGPLKVSDPRYRVEAADLFVRTMQRLGVPYTTDFNAGDLRGVGYLQTTTYQGARCSAADAFLRPVIDDANIRLETGAVVHRVLFEGARAVGVEYVRAGKLFGARASVEVVLAAGAFATPKLLMLSGIGPAQHLEEHGVDVLVDSPGVGSNLQDHNTAILSLETNGPYGYHDEDRGWRMLRNGLQYMAFRSGPVTSNGAETAAFVNLHNDAEDPTLQIYCIGVMWPDSSGAARKRTHGISLLANLVKPRSRGTVRLSSGRAEDDVVINPNWLSDPFDREILLEALRYLREIAASAPLANIIREEASPGRSMRSDEELLKYLRGSTETNYHPVGTCRMGKIDDPMAVLSPRLDVKGVSGLRVVDASMMPTIISANTNATVMAVADRAVDFIAGMSGIRHNVTDRLRVSDRIDANFQY